IEHHAVADHTLASRAQHAAWNELKHKLLAAVDHRVSSVVTARITRHRAEALAQHVKNFALALVAPLGAQYHCRLRSHPCPLPAKSRKLTRRCFFRSPATYGQK